MVVTKNGRIDMFYYIVHI